MLSFVTPTSKRTIVAIPHSSYLSHSHIMRVFSFCRRFIAAFLLALVLVAPQMPRTAQAQLFTDSAARQQGLENADRIDKITAAIRALNEGNEAWEKSVAELVERDKKTRQQISELLRKIQELEQQSREFRGLVDELQQQQSSERQTLQREQQDDIIALQKEIESVKKNADVMSVNLKELMSYYQPPSENELYTSAYTAFQQQNYQSAIEEFNRMLRFYPGGKFNANAQYWISQSHLLLENFTAARDSAEKLILDYPESDKIPAATLIVGRAFFGMEDADAARRQLLLLVEKYPTSLAADEARQLLAQ